MTSKKRLNLVFHGMMIFNEVDDEHIDIIVPEIFGHERKYCVDPTPASDKVHPLEKGSYRLHGPVPNAESMTSLVPPSQCLVVKKDEIFLDWEATKPVSAIIRVPKPTLIRLYRGCEPKKDVFGGTSHQVAYAVPKTHHDVLVFSYKNFHRDEVSLGNLASAQCTDDNPISWIIYSTDPMELSEKNKHETTELNTLLTDREGRHTQFDLSAAAPNDGGPDTPIGLHPRHLATVHELDEQKEQLDEGKLGCGAASCSGIVRG